MRAEIQHVLPRNLARKRRNKKGMAAFQAFDRAGRVTVSRLPLQEIEMPQNHNPFASPAAAVYPEGKGTAKRIVSP